MRRMAVWIGLGVLTGAGLSLLADAGEAMLRTPASGLSPAGDTSNCTALILDRVSGRTLAASCGSTTLPLEASVGAGQRVRT